MGLGANELRIPPAGVYLC